MSTETDDGSVPLKFRGDGLQSRYIASVLHYIAINSTDFYIWGYEEPEIALEYSHASQMANDFNEKYSKSAQIFISTHSPAFIALEGGQISCYRVSQRNSESIVANIALSADLKEKEKLREELGIIEIQKKVHEYYSTELVKLESLNTRVSELESEADELHRPLIVTEGKTDKLILEAAAKNILDDVNSIMIRACDNAGNTGSSGGAGPLGKLIESIHPDDSRLVIAIFDNDDEGQKEYKKLSKNFTTSKCGDHVKKHKNGFAWAMLLPEPDFRQGYIEAKNLCIEYMFTDDILDRVFANGKKLELKDAPPLSIGGQKLDDLPDQMKLFVEEKSKVYRKIGNGKEEFSKDIILKLKIDSFSAFKAIFKTIENIKQM